MQLCCVELVDGFHCKDAPCFAQARLARHDLDLQTAHKYYIYTSDLSRYTILLLSQRNDSRGRRGRRGRLTDAPM